MSEGWQHIEINDHGTIVVLRPISDEGRDWFAEHVGEPEPGGIYTCEPRMAQDILQPKGWSFDSRFPARLVWTRCQVQSCRG